MVRQLTLLFTFVVLAGLSLSATAAPKEKLSKTNPQEKIETAVPEAIRLLEEMEYQKFVKNFVSPDELKKITEETPLEDFAEFFGQNKSAPLLTVLQSIKDEKPAMENGGKKAVFEFKMPIGGQKSIAFKKVGKKWYLEN